MNKAFNIIYAKVKEMSSDENLLCKEFWLKVSRLKEKYDEEIAWELFLSNFQWLMSKNIISSRELIKWFNQEELNKRKIYTNGVTEIKDNFAIGLFNSEIIAKGHSRVILFDSSDAKCYDSTFATANNNAKLELNDCTGEAFNDSTVVVNEYGKVELWDNTKCKSLHYSYIIKHDNSQVESGINAHVLNQ